MLGFITHTRDGEDVKGKLNKTKGHKLTAIAVLQHVPVSVVLEL